MLSLAAIHQMCNMPPTNSLRRTSPDFECDVTRAQTYRWVEPDEATPGVVARASGGPGAAGAHRLKSAVCGVDRKMLRRWELAGA
jgi:hypothetical protein